MLRGVDDGLIGAEDLVGSLGGDVLVGRERRLSVDAGGLDHSG